MAKVIIDWVLLNAGTQNSVLNVIKQSLGSVEVNVVGLPITGDQRPVAPKLPKGVFGVTLAARVIVLEGEVRVAFGADPIAAANVGLYASNTIPIEALAVNPGDKISLIEVAAPAV